jgi:uncharacterized cupredoxin-like copper-binding protein
MRRVPLLVAAFIGVAALAVSPAALARSGSSKLVTTITVVAGKPTEFKFTLSKKTAKRGIIVFKIQNKGTIPHDLKFCTKRSSSLANTCTGRSSKTISPGATTTLRVTVLLKGTYEYLCTLPGHAAAGMKGLLTVG